MSEYVDIKITVQVGLTNCSVTKVMREHRDTWQELDDEEKWDAIAEFAAVNSMYSLSWEQS